MNKIKIRKVPSWLVRLRIIPSNFSIAITPIIFLSKEKYENYKTGFPKHGTEGTIVHESVHIEHQQEMGLFKFFSSYFFSDEFCLQEEMDAIEKEMEIWKSCGKQFDIEGRARELSSVWIYHHCVSYVEAKELLDAFWSQT